MKNSGTKLWDFGSIPMIEPEYLGSILAAASDIALVVTLKGKVLSVLVNDNDRSLGNLSHWEQRKIHDFLTTESIPKLEAVFAQFASGQNVLHPVELNHRDNAIWQFPVSYSIHRLGDADTLLMLGRDLSSTAETQQQLVKAQLAIERGYEERRDFDARYRMILATMQEPVVFVSANDGRIKDINAAAINLFGQNTNDLEGSVFSQLFKNRRRGEFQDALLAISSKDQNSDMTVEDVKLGRRFKIKASLFRASGERLLICRLISENDTSLKDDITTQNLLSLYNLGTDGIVFTSANGFIEAANEGFLDLINTANLGDIKGRSLSEFLARGQIDLAVMLENVTRSGQVRVYATKLQNAVGSKLGVEVSVVRLPSDARETMAFVIRDTNRFEESPAPAITSEDFSQSNVAELVGSSTLREIVGETTDMIEKICIETAIELTQNNRAAAAEMLGLSRQSLYIKLRKFDLLAKDRPS